MPSKKIEKINALYTQKWYTDILSWREKHIKENHFVLIISLFVGILTALAAIVLKTSIHFVKEFLIDKLNPNNVNYLYLAYPALGILLASLFVRYIVKDDIGHGVTKILFSISQRKAIIKPHNMWSSIVGSSLTIGLGGSVGAEAPIVLTGSAIGSNLGRFFKMNQKTLMLLIGCGAAGAIGGIFKAPIAGVVFTLEVLMIDMTMTSVVPLLISSVTATAVSYFFMGNELIFTTQSYSPFEIERIPYIIILGVVCGLVSLYFTRGINALESFFRKITNPYAKLAVGGVTLSILIFFLPTLYGEGYDTISALLNANTDKVAEGSLFYQLRDNSWMIVLYLALTVAFKIVATSATNGAGGVGGIFAPSLFIGCITGYVVAIVMNHFGSGIPERNFALAGMAGLMSGVMHAPLTGIFLIAELTGGYQMFMTLMITSTVSYLTIIIFEPHSLYAMRLAKKGELITHHKDKAVLTLLKMENVIETDLEKVSPEMNLGNLVKVITLSKRNIFPVVDNKGVLAGIVLLDEIRNIMFRPELYERFKVSKLMTVPPAIISIEQPMEDVMKTFEKTQAWNLPVVDTEKRYIGFVSKSNIFNAYRELLIRFSDE